jgi:hypothetical protein
MPTLDEILATFDSATVRREFAMRAGGFPHFEIVEYVAARENRRQEIVRELESVEELICHR